MRLDKAPLEESLIAKMRDHGLLVEGGWQPIETAPKNVKRERVDLWIVRLSSSGKYHDEHRVPDCYWDGRAWRTSWLRAEGHKPFPPHYVPTHWMRLPEPPDA